MSNVEKGEGIAFSCYLSQKTMSLLKTDAPMKAARPKSISVRNLMEWGGSSKVLEDIGEREESS